MADRAVRTSSRQSSRLATCIGTVLASVGPPCLAATSWPVTTCADHGVGSLRDIVMTKAQNGDTVDLSGLPAQAGCSTITLTTAAIPVSQPTLTVLGPSDRITITGKYQNAALNDRIFTHAPATSGTLYLENLDIQYAAPTNKRGGCVYSSFNVDIKNSSVTHCGTNSTAFQARGGGIYASGNLSVTGSVIAVNNVGDPSAFESYGGAAFVNGNLTLTNSSVQGNRVYGVSAKGGALWCSGSVTIEGSTVSGNVSAQDVGGLFLLGARPGSTLTVVNSTISGNIADGAIGGIETRIPTTLRNSTIAFNTATSGDVHRAAGFAVDYAFGDTPPPITLQNTVLSNNCSTPDCSVPADFGISTTGLADAGNVPIAGSHNLVYSASPALPLPVAAAGVCPLLGPLRHNGGPTSTHALLSHSPAIDAGNDAESTGLDYDQRGAPFVRVSGPAADPVPHVDIGAYEVQQDDIVFDASFEGCP